MHREHAGFTTRECIVAYISYHLQGMGNGFLVARHLDGWITTVFICLKPTRRLRPLDLEVLQQLHNVVNVIPVIAKADTLTLDVTLEIHFFFLSSLILFIFFFKKKHTHKRKGKNLKRTYNSTWLNIGLRCIHLQNTITQMIMQSTNLTEYVIFKKSFLLC